MYPHIQFEIPTSNNIGDMLRTRVRLKHAHMDEHMYSSQTLCHKADFGGHNKLSSASVVIRVLRSMILTHDQLR